MAGILNWDLGDSSNNVNANDITHTYATPGNKTVKVYKGTASGASAITKIVMDIDDLVGTLDISSLISIADLEIQTNRKLTNIIFPNSSTAITYIYAYDCSLNGTLDVSGLTGLGGNIKFNTNINLTKILNPTSSGIISSYYAYNCSLNGVLDMSKLIGFGNDFQVYNNKNLTQILNPATDLQFSKYWAYNCGLVGTLDVSHFTRFAGSFDVNNNPGLNTIINPTSNFTFTKYDANSCGLVGTLDVSKLTKIGGFINLYSNPSLNTILTSNSSTAITVFQAQNCDLTGTFDCSSWSNLSGDFRIFNNRKLTNVNFTSSNISALQFYTFLLYDNSLNGTLNISGIKNLSGQFRADGNANLTTIINPSSGLVVTQYYANNCNLTGALDISSLSGLGGDFNVKFNPNLNTIINPVSSQTFASYAVDDCSLNGTLDVSGLTNLGGAFQTYNNTNLQAILLSAIVHPFNTFNVNNCSLNKSSVDDILLKLNTFYKSTLPITNSIYSMALGKNSWPTDGIDNRNLVGIENTFDSSTIYDVSISIVSEPMDSSIDALQFDGSTYIVYSNVADISIFGQPISFAMRLDSSIYGTNYFPKRLIYACSSTNDCQNNFSLMLDGSIFAIQFGSDIITNPSCNGFLNIYDDNLYGQNLLVEIFHAPGPLSRTLQYVKVNGVVKNVTWDLVTHGHTVSGNYPYFVLGAIYNGTTYTNILNKASLWNLRFARTGKWKGYPTGNINAGWTDRIGTNDGSIVSLTIGGPTTQHLTTTF